MSVALSEFTNTWVGRGRDEKRRVEDRSRMSDFLFYISLDRVRPEKCRATSSAVVTSRNNKIARSAHPSGIFPPPFYTGHPLVRSIAHPRPRKVLQVALLPAHFSSGKSDPAGAVKFSRLPLSRPLFTLLEPPPSFTSRVFAGETHSGGRVPGGNYL